LRISNLAYFEYALVLPEERYLIEVQTCNPATGELRGQQEMESIAKECLSFVIGEGHEDVVKELKPNSISESGGQMLTKVQQLLTRPIAPSILSNEASPESLIHLTKIVSNTQPTAAHAAKRMCQRTRMPNWYLVSLSFMAGC
jgi:hypothetical protein